MRSKKLFSGASSTKLKSMNTEIFIAGADHAGEWLRLRSALWPECPPERHRLEIAQLLGSEGLVALARADGKLAGFAEVSIRRDHVDGTTSAPVPYLEGWYVEEKFRGKAVGRALVAFVENWARDRGFVELASDAEIWNEESIRLHGLLGFREVGRTVHFVKTLEMEKPIAE
jgi:aminoglycoside 6'-N-acetyltransferase I